MYNLKEDLKHLARRFVEDDVPALGAQLAYSLLLAFFPFLIFILTLIGYSPIQSNDVLIVFQEFLPTEVYNLISNTVVEITETRSGGLLSFGLITTFWACSNGFKAVIKCLNKAYDQEEDRGFLGVRLVAFLSTFGLAFIIITSVVLLLFGEINGRLIIKWFGYMEVYKHMWNMFRYMLMLATMILIFASLYHFTPSKRLTWKEVLPGSIFASIGWIVSSIIFSYYINNFSRYSKIYGSIGAVIIFMLWLFLVSIILLTGGELNAVLAFDRKENND